MVQVLGMRTRFKRETVMELASRLQKFRIFKFCLEQKVDCSTFNYRGLTSLDYAFENSKLFKCELKSLKQKIRKTFFEKNLAKKNFSDSDLRSLDLYRDYCIVYIDNLETSGEIGDPNSAIINNLEIINELESTSPGNESHCRVLQYQELESPITLKTRNRPQKVKFLVVSVNQSQALNLLTKEPYSVRSIDSRHIEVPLDPKYLAKDYDLEPITQIQKNRVIANLLNKYLDFKVLQQKGLVLDHFPVHQFDTRAKVSTRFNETYLGYIFSVRPRFRSILSSLMSLGNYHGIQVSFFFAFILCYIKWTLLIAVVLAGIHLVSFTKFSSFNNDFVPLSSTVVAVWSSVFYVAWRRFESQLRHVYGGDDASNRTDAGDCDDEVRAGYEGEFQVSRTGYEVVKVSRFSAY